MTNPDATMLISQNPNAPEASFIPTHIMDDPAACANAISACTPLIKHSIVAYSSLGKTTPLVPVKPAVSVLQVLSAALDENSIAPPKSRAVESNGLIAFKLSQYKNIYSYFLNADEIERTERMRKRGDSEEEIHKRIYHDRFKFDTSLNKYIDKFIDEDNKTTDEIAKEIYDDYISRIK